MGASRRQTVGLAAADRHIAHEHDPRQRAPMTLCQLFETQLDELDGAQAECATGDSEAARAPAQPQPQPAPELWPELRAEARHQPMANGDLGQRTLAKGALGTVTPSSMLSAKQRGLASHGRILRPGAGPHYSWLNAEQAPKRPEVPVQAWSKIETPGSPTSVIRADIGLPDELAEVVIVGGGPHALAALAALNEGSLLKEDTGLCCPLPQ